MTPLKNASLSLAEWAALALLSERDGISNKHLARMLGVTGQRASQIGAALIKAGRVTAAQSTEDSRKKVIRVSEVGKSDLVAVNSQIHSLLSKALENNEHALISANKSLRVFSRIVQVDTSEQSLAGGTTQID
jgi:DNA-binding MarR family transcriptional regulator